MSEEEAAAAELRRLSLKAEQWQCSRELVRQFEVLQKRVTELQEQARPQRRIEELERENAALRQEVDELKEQIRDLGHSIEWAGEFN